MSVNVYLNNEVRKLAGFSSRRYKDNPGDDMTFNGVHVFGDKARLYLMWSEDSPIPDELKDLVEEVSCYESIPQMAHRESGIYRHETAECELTPEDYGNAKREKPVYKLKVVAKNMEDIRVILHKVKTGAIRPEESYEGHQQGKSRKQLETELTFTQQQLGEALEDNKGLTIALKSERRATRDTEILRQSAVSEMERLNADLEQVRRELATTQETADLLGQNLSTTQKQLGEVASRNTHWGLMLVAIREFANELATTTDEQFGLKWRPLCVRSNVVKRLKAILDGK